MLNWNRNIDVSQDMKKKSLGNINLHWRQHGLNIPRFHHLYSKREFVNDLEKAGLEMVEIRA